MAPDYSLGWTRSIGEILAEDYARLHVAFAWNIRWIGPPSTAVQQALRRDLADALR